MCDADSKPSSLDESAQSHTTATERTSDEAAACTAINGKAAQSPAGAKCQFSGRTEPSALGRRADLAVHMPCTNGWEDVLAIIQ